MGLLQDDDGYAVAAGFEGGGVEGLDFGDRLEALADNGFEDTPAFAVEDAELFFAEELGIVEESLEEVESFVGAVTAEVEGGRKGLALLVDVVVDGLEAGVLAVGAVDGDRLFLGL